MARQQTTTYLTMSTVKPGGTAAHCELQTLKLPHHFLFSYAFCASKRMLFFSLFPAHFCAGFAINLDFLCFPQQVNQSRRFLRLLVISSKSALKWWAKGAFGTRFLSDSMSKAAILGMVIPHFTRFHTSPDHCVEILPPESQHNGWHCSFSARQLYILSTAARLETNLAGDLLAEAMREAKVL